MEVKMITNNYANSQVSFGAQITPKAMSKIQGLTRGNRDFLNVLSGKINTVKTWGDKNTVITILPGDSVGHDQFVLSNSKLGKRRVVMTEEAPRENMLAEFMKLTYDKFIQAEKALKK
jgi:hypothetical protein